MRETPEVLRKRQSRWNRVTIEAHLGADVEAHETNEGLVTFSNFRFRGTTWSGAGTLRRRSQRVAVMFVGEAARRSVGAIRGQLVLAQGRMVAVALTGRGGRLSSFLRLIADWCELGERPASSRPAEKELDTADVGD